MMAKCNLCGFSVPWDEIGAELMKAHLKEAHEGSEKNDE